MSDLYKTYYDISKLVIWGEADASSTDSKPRLVFSFRDGNPRLTVYTGVMGSAGVISFPSDYPTMVSILNLLKDVVKAEPGAKYTIDSLTNVYVDNKPTSDKRVVGTLHIGKTKDGIIYFSVTAEDRPKIIFPIKKSPYHAYRDANKNDVPDSVISARMAEGIADLYLNILSIAILNYTNEEYSKGERKPTPIRSGGKFVKQEPSSLSEEITSDIDSLDL
jgi:hypothetical protein